jgi:predicted GIY-YIG superfamily endonuclease
MPHCVYVIELHRDVLACRKFANAHPDCRDDKPCVYVGSTVHTPEERFQQHLGGYKANRYAHKYGQRLRPKNYRHLQDFETREEAETEERRLAERLRRRGYAVWWG